MDISTLSVVFSVVFAMTAGVVGGVVYAVRRTSLSGITERLVAIETDIAWIKGALGNREAHE